MDTIVAPTVQIADYSTYDSLEALGIKINITSESMNRAVVPLRVVGGSDVFCTRELNMEQMEAVGFDMDFTLAQYTNGDRTASCHMCATYLPSH